MTLARFGIFALVVASHVASSTAQIEQADLEEFLTGLWIQSDTDGDGVLQEKEFIDALEKLGLDCAIFDQHEKSCTVLFADIDAESGSGEAGSGEAGSGGDGGITPAELVSAATLYPEYKDPLQAAFTNGAGQVPSGLPAIPAGIASAQGMVTVTMILAIAPADIFPGQRAQITTFFADTSGVPAANILVTFLAQEARRLLLAPSPSGARATASPRKMKLLRKLQGTSTLVTAKLYTANPAEAEAAAAALQAADPATAPAFSGIAVSSFTVTPEALVPALPVTSLAIVAAAFVGALVFLCTNASFWSGRVARDKRAKGADTATGCCKSGGCSFNAVPAWAFGEIIAALAILVTTFYVYTEVTGVTDSITGLIGTLLQLLESNFDLIQQFSKQVPDSLVNPVRQNAGLLRLLPLAVMLPGILAALFLVAGALCGSKLFKATNKGSYRCTKCMVFFADILLLLALIFYAVFAAFSLVFQFVPVVKRQIGQVRGMCDVVPSQINQMLGDNEAALDKLSAIGSPQLVELQATFDNITVVGGLVDDACGFINLFISEMIAMFFPGFLCVVAIGFALFINQTLCCAAGCCCYAPPAEDDKPKVVASGGMGSAQVDVMQSV